MLESSTSRASVSRTRPLCRAWRRRSGTAVLTTTAISSAPASASPTAACRSSGSATASSRSSTRISTVAVVYNGELFDYPERKAELQAKGHVFRTHTDTEIIVHLYEEYGEGVFEQLRGQFAIALIDFTKRTIFLARDRVGICPLHWSRQGDWLFFGSEIKALLASGSVPARARSRAASTSC